MNTELAYILNSLNTSFYQKVSDSFSATRQSPWNGWQSIANHLLTIIPNGTNKESQAITVLDLACGNMRFEEFLANKFSQNTFEFYCYDNCLDLLPKEKPNGSHLKALDISKALLENSLDHELQQPECDLSVAFGFMHHLPTKEMRLALLEALINNTKEGGLIAVSFWQFMNHEKMAKKAQITTELALQQVPELKNYFCSESSHENKIFNKFTCKELDKNDYFLGWKDTQGIYRYCHHFDQAELDWLIKSISYKAQLIDTFQADGRNDSLNSYLIFEKK